MLRRVSLLFPLIFLIFLSKILHGQSEISSPYSGFGIGILSNTSNGVMASMGGVSYAMQNNLYINYKNPASYVAFDSLSFIGDASMSFINSTLKTSAIQQKHTIGRFNYLMIGLPVTRIWRTSVGFLPYSDVGYKIYDNNEEDIKYSYDGDGGLMQLYWGNAFKICKGLSIGLNASYMFGRLSNIRFIYYTGDNFFNSRILHNTYLDGIYLSGGLQYFIPIKQKSKLGLGVVYENTAYIWARENILINNFTGNFSSTTDYDTIYYVDADKGNLVIPQKVGFGISYSYDNKLLVGADFSWQNWSNYELMGKKDSLKDAFNVALGVQYTPDPTSSKYHKKMQFRVGTNFSTGYLMLRDTPIQEFGVTFGIGFPFRTYTSQSSVNIMFEYGQMGTIQNDLILQRYFKISLSFILHEKWYQRVRLE